MKMEPQNFTDEEMSNLWWRKSDYEDFARVGRIITKAILEGGSEVWLESKSTPSSPRRSGSDTDRNSRAISQPTTKDDFMIDSSSSSSSSSNPPLHYDYLSESKSQEFFEMREKWWHKFGHSRRGLEHIASSAEGRQRYLNGRSAVRSVKEEQRRQMMFLPKGYSDVDKLRSVYLKQTQWARILARAAGESDADAVQTNFDESRRKPREYYLKKHFDNNSDHVSTSNEMNLPIFMKNSMSSIHLSKRLNLDANTVSQICFRKSQILPLISKPQEKQRSESPPLDEEKKSESDDANDDNDATSSSSLAKKAAGWGGDESHEDMSSVLIGMGTSTKANITVG
jgi:hypothetical protein